MSTFEVLVRTIDDVIDHPNADRLSICKILGYEAITNKLEDGSHRYVAGQNIVYVPEAAIVPEALLKQFHYWNDEKDCGMLSGKRGDRVKALRLRGVLSQGLVWPLNAMKTMDGHKDTVIRDLLEGEDATAFYDHFTHDGTVKVLNVVNVGDDVAEFFGITKYEPPIPMGMDGEVCAAYEFSFDYDIENEQNFPGFLNNDEVEATEKLHGTNTRIAYRHGVQNDELFGSDGCVAMASKSLGAKGLVFKNNEKNVNNVYVNICVGLGLVEKMEQLGRELEANIDLFGEIFGPGVQDLHYGQTARVFRAFDIAINGRFLPTDEKVAMFARLDVERVPVLYRGPWDREALLAVRDGKTTFGEKNVREGIVVTATGDQTKREYMNHRLRPFLKMINPDYLTRKGDNITEFQ